MNAESPGVYDDEPRPGPQSCRLDGHRGYHGGFCRIHQLTCAAPACRRLANPRNAGRQCRLGRHYRGAGRMTWAPSLPSQKLGSYVHSKLAALPFQDLGTGRLKAAVIGQFQLVSRARVVIAASRTRALVRAAGLIEPSPHTAEILLHPLQGRTPQLMLASRLHPLAPGQSHRRRAPAPARRLLPLRALGPAPPAPSSMQCPAQNR